MQYQNLYIDLLKEKNINNIHEVWIDSLPNNVKTLVGKEIIVDYLNKYFEVNNNLSVGIYYQKELIGFNLFGDDQEIMKHVIKKKFFKIVSTFLVNVFKLNIKHAIRFVDTFIFVNLNKKIEKKIRNDNKNTELIIAGIKKKYQNKGIGTFFLNKIFLEYKNYFSKFEYVFLKTLPTTQNLTYFKKYDFISESKISGRIYLKRKI